MIARAFKPVVWVAAVAVPALGCYMLSLKVAAERAELANVETRILAARQDIRTLQTELGTRGRLQQLEQWNADVLALAAPVAGQFVGRQVSLARFDTRPQEFTPGASVQVAAAEVPRAANPVALAPRQASLQRPAAEPEMAAPTVRRAQLTEQQPAAAPRRAAPAQPLVRRASLASADERPARQAAPAPQRRPSAAAPRAERTRPLVSAETERALARRARTERD
jgi:hypothetical protein